MTTGPSLDALDRVAQTIGDRWSMLIIAALAGGGHRYGELSNLLPGISSNVLAQRLAALTSAGLVIAEPYSVRPDRLRYDLAADGRELARSLLALAAWSNGNAPDAGGEEGGLRHELCGGALQPRLYCPTCDADVLVEAGSDEAFHI